jgi:ATP-dependent Clp protease ATP-binding subunit ClpA
VVSRWTGIPIAKLDEKEKVKLMHLADRLHERVVGQNQAVELVAEAVLRSRAGIAQPGQPIGSFLFLGLTGVGKTELSKALAEQLFDSEKMLVRFDMTEYSCPSSVTRLIGAPPRFNYKNIYYITLLCHTLYLSLLIWGHLFQPHKAIMVTRMVDN